ncbi:MAG: thiamine phosphate synthase [Tessaracoccus sp.]|uniref:thiamine phosphate synthase n=1 Tax=Tessaracoccus sp. TaxID=1971211 RepID=UPI001ECA1606|nr:thiamine phosphate synthase [Tessaracoccus sp.]MBK7820038.1 thiamine phosphate synthase [Tessaracoccus sp.]
MTTAAPGVAEAIDWRLYFVTDTTLSGGPDRVPWVVEQAVLGGAGVIQVRDKELPDDEFLALTRAVVAANERAFAADGRSASIVVNDRLDVAAELGLHLHLGQSDGDIREARRRLGAGVTIGLSVAAPAHLEAELADPTADVVGLSPIWATPTKTDTDPALGPDGARALVRQAAGRVKTVAIGGVNARNARAVIETGVDGICVVSAIAAAPDPRAAAQELLALWRNP